MTGLTTATTLMTRLNDDRVKPLLTGAALLAAGYLLTKVNPDMGSTPKATLNGSNANRRRRARAAEFARDSADAFAPSNLTDQIGKSLITGGIALIAARVFDELAALDD